MVQNQHSSPDNMDSPKAQDHDTVVLANNKTPPLEGEHYMKIGGMWTLKHEIRLPNYMNSSPRQNSKDTLL